MAVSKTNTNPCSYPVPADLREEERREEKKRQEKKRQRKKREGRLEKECKRLVYKAGGTARGRGGMKAGQQKRKLTAGVKVLSDSQFVSSDHLS